MRNSECVVRCLAVMLAIETIVGSITTVVINFTKARLSTSVIFNCMDRLSTMWYVSWLSWFQTGTKNRKYRVLYNPLWNSANISQESGQMYDFSECQQFQMRTKRLSSRSYMNQDGRYCCDSLSNRASYKCSSTTCILHTTWCITQGLNLLSILLHIDMIRMGVLEARHVAASNLKKKEKIRKEWEQHDVTDVRKMRQTDHRWFGKMLRHYNQIH